GRLQQEMGVDITVGDLFERPVLADLARSLESAARVALPAITPSERGERIPLSYAQQRLWFLAQLEGVGAAYHMPFGMRLRGELNHAALKQALDRIVERHQALRTTFVTEDGEPFQRIKGVEESCFYLVEHDLRGRSEEPERKNELDQIIVEEARAPFDLEVGPVVRGRLIRESEDGHVLLITKHHIVSDAWSMDVFIEELNTLYAAFVRRQADPLPALEVQYADYAVWQRRWMEGEILRQQGDYWKRTLTGAPVLLELPADRARPPQQDYAGDVVEWFLDEELTAVLKALRRRHGATLFMTLLGSWAVLLGRLSRQPEVVVGTPVANRGRREIEKLIGFFVNTLALRVDVSG